MSGKITIGGKEAVEKAVQGSAAHQALLGEYGTHDVYHIEAWQQIIFIPGGTRLLRVHYIYDKVTGKAFLKDHSGKITLVAEVQKIKELKRFIRHYRKASENGIFVRKLARVDWSSSLFHLMEVMNGGELTVRLPPEIESARISKRKEKQFIEILFDTVLSEK